MPSSDAVDALLRLPDAIDGCPLAGARDGLSRHGVFGLNLSRAHARHVLAGGQGPC